MLENIKAFYHAKRDPSLWFVLLIAVGFGLYYYYDEYSLVGMEVFLLFAGYLVISSASKFTERMATDTRSSRPVFYCKVIFWSLTIAYLCSSMLGTYVENADPLFSGGERVTDVVPTNVERAKHFWKVFLIVLLPATHGAIKGFEASRFKLKRTAKED